MNFIETHRNETNRVTSRNIHYSDEWKCIAMYEHHCSIDQMFSTIVLVDSNIYINVRQWTIIFHSGYRFNREKCQNHRHSTFVNDTLDCYSQQCYKPSLIFASRFDKNSPNLSSEWSVPIRSNDVQTNVDLIFDVSNLDSSNGNGKFKSRTFHLSDIVQWNSTYTSLGTLHQNCNDISISGETFWFPRAYDHQKDSRQQFHHYNWCMDAISTRRVSENLDPKTLFDEFSPRYAVNAW